MRAKILMLSVLVPYTSVTLLGCQTQPPLRQIDSQNQVTLSSYQSEQTMTEKLENPTVEIKFIERILRRPPQSDLLMDVTLHNRYTQPCWFLLPATIDSEPLGQGGIHAVEVSKLGGKGNVILGRLVGTAHLQAFLLPAGAKVKIRRLPIALWEENIVDKVQIEVIVASEMTINGEPAQAWFGINPMSSQNADVSAEQSRRLNSRNTSNFDEVPLSVVEKERFNLKVVLTEN